MGQGQITVQHDDHLIGAGRGGSCDNRTMLLHAEAEIASGIGEIGARQADGAVGAGLSTPE